MQLGHDLMQVLRGRAHAQPCNLACQQRERAGMTIHRFDQIRDFLWRVARVVVLRIKSFLPHHLADQLDGILTAERIQADFTVLVIERRG